MSRENTFTTRSFTKGLIVNRLPGNRSFYDLEYFRGAKSALGVPFHEEDLKPDSHYRHKAVANLKWINKYVPDGIIVDAGSGPGHLAYWSEVLSYPYKVISSDVSGELLTSKYNLNPKRSIVSHINALPITNTVVSAVLFGDVLEHVYPEDAEKAVQEAHRILVDGGYVFIRIPNRRACGWDKYHLRDESHVWLPTPKEMKRLLFQNGFSNVRIKTREIPILTKIVRKYTSGKTDVRLPSFVPGSSMMISAKK